jgi:hypothetical protein
MVPQLHSLESARWEAGSEWWIGKHVKESSCDLF